MRLWSSWLDCICSTILIMAIKLPRGSYALLHRYCHLVKCSVNAQRMDCLNLLYEIINLRKKSRGLEVDFKTVAFAEVYKNTGCSQEGWGRWWWNVSCWRTSVRLRILETFLSRLIHSVISWEFYLLFPLVREFYQLFPWNIKRLTFYSRQPVIKKFGIPPKTHARNSTTYCLCELPRLTY